MQSVELISLEPSTSMWAGIPVTSLPRRSNVLPMTVCGVPTGLVAARGSSMKTTRGFCGAALGARAATAVTTAAASTRRVLTVTRLFIVCLLGWAMPLVTACFPKATTANVRELSLRPGSHTGMKALRLLPLPLVLVVGALALAACGSDEAAEPPTPPPPSIAGIGAGPGISIEEAIALESSEPVLVNGWVYARGGEVRFCDAIAESYPPQCPGVSLLV